jgi:hypothetical protein
MHSLTSALDGGEWSASRPGRFTPRERAPGGNEESKSHHCLSRQLNPSRPTRTPAPILTELSWLLLNELKGRNCIWSNLLT